MSNTSGSKNGRMEVPEAKGAMDKLKMEVASEMGVNLKNGYKKINVFDFLLNDNILEEI